MFNRLDVFPLQQAQDQSQHCSPEKMDEAKKDSTNSVGRRSSPPNAGNEASCSDCSPGMSLSLPDSSNYGPEKYSAFRQKMVDADVVTPGASSILGVSAKSNPFCTTVLVK